jgi:hypothetical protein
MVGSFLLPLVLHPFQDVSTDLVYDANDQDRTEDNYKELQRLDGHRTSRLTTMPLSVSSLQR